MAGILLAVAQLFGCVKESEGAKALTTADREKTIYDFTMPDIDGKPVPLAKYKGHVLVVVNVASKCGFTYHYEGLEALYKKHHAEGFDILGFPANDFRSQEPGTNAEIKEFCSSHFGVTFPLFAKTTVRGEKTNDLYKWLIANSGRMDEIEWNFAKFVIGRDGKVKARFAPDVKPDNPDLNAAIEKELKAPKPAN